MRLFDLSGKVAIVTGGNGGIGLGMAKGLAEAGAAVAIAARDEAKAASAVAEIKALGAHAAFVRFHAGKPESCRAMVETVEREFGRLDILVNNAGISIRKLPQEYTAEEWQSVLDVNLNSAFWCAQAAYGGMHARGGGKIINIGSMMSLFAAPYSAPYAASKGGILQTTRALAVAWAKDNIQVNAILPGWIDTELTRNARNQVPGLHDRVLGRTPAGRWGAPEDFAGIAVFLAAPASDFVTGAGIVVDGGYSSLA
ncbi:MAG TPA: glucose 1-dehydrogenase [Acetobacteraceae bacterium]|nr:glucose 1-dehydrogenase [Acetobacteraceae bacterium]